MGNHRHEPAKVRHFSLAFEQMCSMVAVGQVRNPDETLRNLLLQCMAFLPDEVFNSEQDFQKALDGLLGLQISEHEINYAIDRLLADAILQRAPNGSLVLPRPICDTIKTSIENAHQLEEQVVNGWQREIATKFPRIPFDSAWKALKNYLAKAFHRHGMQTVALLEPSMDIPAEYLGSLSELLRDALLEFPEELKAELRNVVSDFIATIGSYPERSAYIAQLADGAFNYFSLTVESNIADQFRCNLNPLIIFLDTNFLFGILDLTVNPQVAVSNELLNAIHKYGFPFELTHHKKTEQELLSSISNYEGILRSRRWSQGISRAAMNSRILSGVELRYHQKFAETGIDVENFFKPYKHADVILAEKQIKKYTPSEERVDERARLASEYLEYLGKRNKKKSYTLVDHDTTVLDVTRQYRSNRNSTLEAGALFLTCDYNLYRFDWETSKSLGIMPCTVLPNLFWQILRPYVPSDTDFSRSFAETFALPEFRTIGSGASEACSRMLSMLASYNDFPEETAARMLSNDLLIDQLKKAENDQEFQDYIEAAIVRENADLAEELALVEAQLEQEKTEKAKAEQKLGELSVQKDKEISEAVATIQKLQGLHAEDSTKITTLMQEFDEEKRLRKAAEERKSQIEQNTTRMKENYSMILKVVLATVISSLLITLFEVAVYRIPWPWLVNHPRSIAIQISVGIAIVLGLLGALLPKWRKVCWILVVLPVLVGLLQLI